MQTVIHPTYFPNVAHYSAMLGKNSVLFEINDNYQKQTLRNRTNILGANGVLPLTVPVNYTQKNRQLYKDVKISKETNWQTLHLKSLESAYKMSPFFEYYIDDLLPIFNKTFNFLLDVNLKIIEVINALLELDISSNKTTAYLTETKDIEDLRFLAKKNMSFNFSSYDQVFDKKYDFTPNLSILDLLFNEGPNTEIYLKKQQNNFNNA